LRSHSTGENGEKRDSGSLEQKEKVETLNQGGGIAANKGGGNLLRRREEGGKSGQGSIVGKGDRPEQRRAAGDNTGAKNVRTVERTEGGVVHRKKTEKSEPGGPGS